MMELEIGMISVYCRGLSVGFGGVQYFKWEMFESEDHIHIHSTMIIIMIIAIITIANAIVDNAMITSNDASQESKSKSSVQ